MCDASVSTAATAVRRRARAGLIGLALALALTGAARAQSPVITPAVDIDQAKLEAGKYPLPKVLASGGQFFTTPYLPWDAAASSGDGYGEGPNGPRQAQRKAFYPPAFPKYHFLRMNGLDSQSCYECHNSIGNYSPAGTAGGALTRKPGTVGGSAGSNSNAFINPKFPSPITLLIRNPPHVFGTGYTQALSLEITRQLVVEREAAHLLAHLKPGTAVAVPLSAKGESFGTLRSTFTGGAAKVTGCTAICAGTTPTFGEAGFTDDFSQVTGVACDLVVRPFQWKGISSSIRHFVRDALDFHFSMQAVEKYGDLDCDKDGKRGEMTLGNVSALVSFVGMTRPPQQQIPPGQAQEVELGRQIFVGKASDPKVQGALSGAMCATCHAATLKLDVPVFTVQNPGPAQVKPKDCASLDAGLVTPVASHKELEIAKTVEQPVKAARAALEKRATGGAKGGVAAQAAPIAASTPVAQVVEQLRAAVQQQQQNAVPPLGQYAINLTNPGKDVPPAALPRLPAGPGGTVEVPLLSDLRTHNMGQTLQDRVAQGADVADICIAPPLFLTRPLWGVADTPPYLHDGRALTLRDAILQHSGPGSEANGVVAAFQKLTPAQQQAVVTYLLSLRLPIEGDLVGAKN